MRHASPPGPGRDPARRGRSAWIACAWLPLLFATPGDAATVTARRAFPPPLAIVDVTLIDATGAPARPHMTVVVREGRIAAIGTARATRPPADALLIEGAGRFLIPALWDMHIHLANREDTTLEERVILPLLVAHGVVGVRDMGGDFARIQRLRERIAAGALAGPEILSPGPFVGGLQDSSALFMPVATDSAARAAVRTLKARGVDFIKVQAGLSLACLAAVADESHRLGLGFAGHVPEAVRALDMVSLKPRSIEHVSPALPGDAGLMLGCSSREDELRRELRAIATAWQAPGAARDSIRARERVLQAAILESYDVARATSLFGSMVRQDVWSVPTLIGSRSFHPLGREDSTEVPMRYFPDAMERRWEAGRKDYIAAVPPGDLALSARIATRSVLFTGAMRAAGVRILAGTDAFDAWVLPGFSLHQELALLVDAGLSPMEALQSATLGPAQFLERARTQGTIERGKQADLLLLDADPLADIRNTRRIAALVQGGIHRSRADLDALLAGAEVAGRGPAEVGR